MKVTSSAILTVLVFGCIAFLPNGQAVIPAPDGGYPSGNTAEGQTALLSLTTGGFNTALGFLSLRSNSTNSFNTGVGAGTLLANTADENTATGAGALLSNTVGTQNTATGAFALFNNTEGSNNVANGAGALQSNTSGNFNIAVGKSALSGNTTGIANIAVGDFALFHSTTGSSNVALGSNSGVNVTTANNVICLGANAVGENVNSSCYISNIFAKMSAGGINVLVNSNGKLGTTVSSQRFKDDIKPMERASEALLALKPVTFRYKKEIDPAGTSQFGLVAEEVEKVNPDLVVRDQEGKPYTVRYDQVNAMLLNEFLKEHRKVEEQGCKIENQARKIQEEQTTIMHLQKQMETVIAHSKEQDAQIQKVSTQTELSKAAPKVVANQK
jgi:hypothetical protein